MKNIIITGASRGIGYETAKQLVETGHRVIAISRNQEKLNQLSEACKAISGEGALYHLSFCLATGDYQKELIPFITQHFNEVDGLINNAGYLVNKPFAKLTDEDIYNIYNVNVFSIFKIIRSLLPKFQPFAHILNIGSMGGCQGSAKFSGLSAYSSSKGALSILSECLAEEFKDRKLAVNCLALGAVQTEMLAEAFPDYRASLQAGDMASFISHFALEGHRYFNGKVLPVSLSTP